MAARHPSPVMESGRTAPASARRLVASCCTAWRQAQVMEYKVCGPANACLGDIELAIEDAASPYTLVGMSGGNETNTFIPKPVADVINLSLGDTAGDPAGSTSVMANNAALAGTIVVCAAGNAGPGSGTIG